MQGISENLGEAPNASPIEQATYLTPEQQKLATQTFETQVQPLRKGFEERLETGVEGLARRGVAFGGVGSQGLADIFEAQTQAEAQLAGQIATGLGARSLDQAFQASETAKQREFTRGERLGTQEFARGERLGTQEFAGEEALQQREFIQSESALNRASQIEQLNISADQKETLMRLNADLDMQAQEEQRDFTTQEREAIQEYNTASQQAGFDQQFDILKYQSQQNRLQQNENRLLNMLNTGQITAENSTEIIRNLLDDVLTNPETGEFEGFNFTPQDELLMQQQAEQAGLSVDEYIDIRNKLGSKQKDVILEQIEDFVYNPEVIRQRQEELAEIQTEAFKEDDEGVGVGKVADVATDILFPPKFIFKTIFGGKNAD